MNFLFTPDEGQWFRPKYRFILNDSLSGSNLKLSIITRSTRVVVGRDERGGNDRAEVETTQSRVRDEEEMRQQRSRDD